MGAYRSEPDRIKITYELNNKNIEFAVCHMCGTYLLI